AFLGDATVLRAVEAHGDQMRAPPHQDHLPGGEGEVRRDLLREEGDPPRDLAALEARTVESLEEDATASGKKEAGEDAKERALARAVLADDAEDLPRRHLEVDVAEAHAAVLSLQADPARLEKQLVTADPLRRRLRGRARPPLLSAARAMTASRLEALVGVARSRPPRIGDSDRPFLPHGAAGAWRASREGRTAAATAA